MTSKSVKSGSAPRGRTALRGFWRWVRRLSGAVALIVLMLRWINPPINYLMAREWIRLGSIEQEWVPLETMSPYLALSAAAAEDVEFCRHWGIDISAVRQAFRDQNRTRGGSTISQQVAKNVFLWPDRSWLRKGIEAGFTGLIELLWGKRRIMEVYLNVAEFDTGVFGVAAASRHYFDTPAGDVSAVQAARLMAILPAPRSRSAIRPSAQTQQRARQIMRGAATIRVDGRAECFTS